MMSRRPDRRASVAALLALIAASAAADVSREEIFVLNTDGESYTVYKTLRSELPGRALFLAEGESVDDYVYIHPADFQQETTDDGTRLVFDSGDYALMRADRFRDWQLSDNPDGSTTFHSWDGRELDNGHYGKWNSPDPFAHFSYVWILPENIEVLDAQSNRDGDWRQQGRTLAWRGEQVNDLTFRIRFQRQAPETPTFRAVPDDAELPDAERITLDSAVLFASGRHRLTSAGEQLLVELADRLKTRGPTRVIVAGHTDNQPLKPYLQERYPSNWELSAARATGVVRFLAEQGVDAGVLEARAFGAEQPVADNDTTEGRARNRRIEITIAGATAASQADTAATGNNENR
ncbi:OmpA family protein [Salinisphaera sp. P385]|uniref:OmpA family protein n=1 Tax=Spectribacter acetivorans TaxID=3075603 RepID=A0ABU3BC33_9GAMM|nr:OmpA family protein [Salinisphaera sp. P385]MDT0619698.1 OmpA family protein [Salinisphaera sp. P385]